MTNHDTLEQLTRNLLKEIGENPDREGLVKTPSRVAKSWEFFSKGYNQNLEDIINNAIFKEDAKDMVIVRDVEFFSLCEHHLLPFFGKAHVGYIPNGKVIGLSKIPRIIDMFSRRLQVQERLTHQVAEVLQDVLNPIGVGVVIKGILIGYCGYALAQVFLGKGYRHHPRQVIVIVGMRYLPDLPHCRR